MYFPIMGKRMLELDSKLKSNPFMPCLVICGLVAETVTVVSKIILHANKYDSRRLGLLCDF